jgi:hypothetical protein
MEGNPNIALRARGVLQTHSHSPLPRQLSSPLSPLLLQCTGCSRLQPQAIATSAFLFQNYGPIRSHHLTVAPRSRPRRRYRQHVTHLPPAYRLPLARGTLQCRRERGDIAHSRRAVAAAPAGSLSPTSSPALASCWALSSSL